jgi:hypothetical protein
MWRTKQADRRSLVPIRARVCTDSTADSADHALPEGRHWHVVGVIADV